MASESWGSINKPLLRTFTIQKENVVKRKLYYKIPIAIAKKLHKIKQTIVKNLHNVKTKYVPFWHLTWYTASFI